MMVKDLAKRWEETSLNILQECQRTLFYFLKTVVSYINKISARILHDSVIFDGIFQKSYK